MKISRLFAMTLVVLGLSVSGCSIQSSESHRECPTVGRELIDLKTALETGSISEKDAESLRSDILAWNSCCTASDNASAQQQP